MKIFLKIIFLLSGSIAFGQDIHFSQFYELPLLRNPALAGIYSGDGRVTAAFRSQWGNASAPAAPFMSQAISGEIRAKFPKNSDSYTSFGLQVTNDYAGDARFGKVQFLPVIAYNQLLSSDYNLYATAAFMGGFVSQHFDFNKLHFDDQFVNGAYSPTNPTRQTFTNSNVNYLDMSAGLSFSGNITENINWYLGGALFHISKPKVAFIQTNDVILNRKVMINGGLTFPINDFARMTIFADYFKQGGSAQGQGGILFKQDIDQQDDEGTLSLSAGAMYRANDAVIPVIKMDIYRFGVGLSYDVNISKLQAASKLQNAFELTFSYRAFANSYRSVLNRTNCPVFKY
jgi:type IX secretion system PorP/SprF family membrane protein